MYLCHDDIIPTLHACTVEKPKVIGKPENKSVISEETNVNLTVTAKGRDMKFEWHKHGEHYDDIEIIEDDELYRVIELVSFLSLTFYLIITHGSHI